MLVEILGGYYGDKGPILVKTDLEREEDKVIPNEAITGGGEINSVVDEEGKRIPFMLMKVTLRTLVLRLNIGVKRI